MATPNQYVQTPTFYLAGSGCIIGATSINVTGFSDILGTVLTMANFGTTGYGTLEPDTSNEEGFTFTSVVANANGTFTLGGIKTVLPESPYTQTSGLIRSHGGGQKVVVTDNVAFWASFANKANDETVTGTWTFNNQPVALSATPASTTALGNVRLSSAPATTLGNPTITIASPAVVTLASHGLTVNDVVQFTTTGLLPTGMSLATNYYVIAAGLTANAFEISTTVGGTAVVTSGSQSGTHTLIRTTAYAVGNDDIRIPTTAQGQALAGGGNFGTPGPANKFITQSYNSSAQGVAKVTVFTASGTYTKSGNLKYAIVEGVGGGGGSGGSNVSGGGYGNVSGGGGGGGYFRKLIQASILNPTETVFIGPGGTAGAGGSGVTAGGAGGNTTFSSFSLQGTGGGGSQAGGGASAYYGGAGGGAINGDINVTGGSGTSSFGVVGSAMAGTGGNSVLGGGAVNQTNGAGGVAGNAYGGGASGGQSNGGGSFTGGAGAPGVVIITEYFS